MFGQPKNVALNDDHLRETVVFTETESTEAEVSHLELSPLLANARQFCFHAVTPKSTKDRTRTSKSARREAHPLANLFCGTVLEIETEADRGRTNGTRLFAIQGTS